MTIRPATIKDSKILSSLILRASESVRKSDFSIDGWKLLEATNTVDAFEKRFRSEHYFALIYEAGDIPVGYLSMIGFEKIDHMFVLPEFRRLGVSSALWKQAAKVCEEYGHGSYYWVRSSSVAEHAYRSFGFRPSGERQITNGISSQLMEMGIK